MGVPVPRWREPAGAAAERTQAGANAGGLRCAARRTAAVAGLSAQPGRKSGGLGGIAGRAVPARVTRGASAVDLDRRLCGIGGGDSDGLSARAAPALLGAQNAQYRSEERRVGKECRSRWSPYH